MTFMGVSAHKFKGGQLQVREVFGSSWQVLVRLKGSGGRTPSFHGVGILLGCHDFFGLHSIVLVSTRFRSST